MSFWTLQLVVSATNSSLGLRQSVACSVMITGMNSLGGNSKKALETHYMEEARRASSIFPQGELVSFEKPDFLLRTESGTIGIEETELCREDPRAEASRLSKVPAKAKAIYDRMVNAQTVDVSA